MPTVSRNARFGRVLTAMATPFDRDGAVDLDGVARLATALVEAGNDGLVVTGSTGESTVLTDAERVAIWQAAVGAVDVPVLAGSTTADTAHSIELTEAATRAGVAGILAVTPYYSRPSQAGLEAHFRSVAAATELPVVLYDIPGRTGRRLLPETVETLAGEVPNIVGLKDASGDPAGTARLLAELPSEFECYCGDDSLTLPLLSIGAVGLIGVATHWCSAECGEMIRRFLDGDVDGALEIERALLASFAFESSDQAPNPQPTKAMLAVLGLPGGSCRLPLGPPPSGLEDRAKSVLADLDAWRRQRP